MVAFLLGIPITFTIQTNTGPLTFTVPNAVLGIVRGIFNGSTNRMDSNSLVPFSINLTGPGIQVDLTRATVFLNKNGFVFSGTVEVTQNLITRTGIASPATYSYGQVLYPDLLDALVSDTNIQVIPGFIIGGTNVQFPILYDDQTSEIVTIQNPSILLPETAQYFPRTGTVVLVTGTAEIRTSPIPIPGISLFQSFTIRQDGTVDLFEKRVFFNGKFGIITQQAGYPLITDTLNIIAAKLKRISSEEPEPIGGGEEQLVCICGQLIPRSQVFGLPNCKKICRRFPM